MGILDNQWAVLIASPSELLVPLALALSEAGAALAVVNEASVDAETLKQLRVTGTVTTYASQADLDLILNLRGAPDILVTLPPTPVVRPSLELTEADFRAVLEGSLIRAFRWSQAIGRRMVQAQSGVIVHVTGLSGLGGWPGWLPESAAFAGVHQLTHTLAVEWAKDHVRVNCLVPGVTEATREQIEDAPSAPSRDAILRRIPVGRTATSDDIAQALLYLVDPRSSYVSGEILRVDGGWDSWGRLYAAAKRANS